MSIGTAWMRDGGGGGGGDGGDSPSDKVRKRWEGREIHWKHKGSGNYTATYNGKNLRLFYPPGASIPILGMFADTKFYVDGKLAYEYVYWSSKWTWSGKGLLL